MTLTLTFILLLLALASFFGGGAPKMPPPPPPPPPIIPDDSAEMAELARKRKSLEASRVGRSKLVIPIETGGLRIPE